MRQLIHALRRDPIGSMDRSPFRQPLIVAYFAVASSLLIAFGIAMHALPEKPGAGIATDEAEAIERFSHYADPMPAALAARSAGAGSVLTVEHRVPIGAGRELFVTETFTPEALFRTPRRAVLFLSGSAFRGNHWSIPVEGYNATEMAARRGFFAFTVDYLGVGESFAPADGREVTFEANLAAMETVISYIRWRRFVKKVDLVGAGYGGSLATVLAEDRRRVRSVVMSAMLYDVSVGGPLQDPDFVAMLESAPDGYAFIPGEASLIFTQDSPQELNDYIVATQGGFYPAENFLVATRELPFYDPGAARAPGLILFGRQDDLVGPNGMDGLVRDYGGSGALLVVNDAARHAPRTERPDIAAWFWHNVWAFLDPDPIGPRGEATTDGDPWIDALGGNGDLPLGIEFSMDPGPGDLPAGIELSLGSSSWR